MAGRCSASTGSGSAEERSKTGRVVVRLEEVYVYELVNKPGLKIRVKQAGCLVCSVRFDYNAYVLLCYAL